MGEDGCRKVQQLGCQAVEEDSQRLGDPSGSQDDFAASGLLTEIVRQRLGLPGQPFVEEPDQLAGLVPKVPAARQIGSAPADQLEEKLRPVPFFRRPAEFTAQRAREVAVRGGLRRRQTQRDPRVEFHQPWVLHRVADVEVHPLAGRHGRGGGRFANV